ncbi:MAG: bifunctional homocysteine S-methyltransferase/methylenetetrahydrofolate reductase [Armatimonadetes bacterium]|nr:bifunctional homocysteine S-methyltransferase/methylenetetrahydrofolate reductase [Armatimonadota bacterium]
MLPFLERLKQGPVVCDGAMGTQLYERGIFLNQIFENINLMRPDLVSEIHRAYVQAGAEIIETNSYGANRIKLTHKGLSDEVRAINEAAVRIAREAVPDTVYLAGSVGPSGLVPTILTERERRDLEEAFYEQCAILLEGGIHLLMLETFNLVSEMHVALRAARRAAGNGFPIVALVAFDAEGMSGDGATPERAVELLADWGADVGGVNCVEGPQAVFQVAERMVGHGLPICAQPNAGYPQRIDGRTVYMSTPEYFGEYAKRMFQVGVSIVGGCCGTGPEHIRWTTGSARMLGGGRVSVPAVPRAASLDVLRVGPEPVPTRDKSKLAAKVCRVYEERIKSRIDTRPIGKDNFVVSVEVNPPTGLDLGPAMRGARMLAEAGVDVINSSDGPRATVRVSNSVFTHVVQTELGLETILHVCCRDRNLLRLTADLFASYVQGLHNLVIITGDPPKTTGDYPHATAVFDLDSIGLLKLVQNLNHGLDPAGKPMRQVTRFFSACGVEPGALDYDRELRRLEEKKAAGAEMIMTQPVYDAKLLRRFLDDTKHLEMPVLVGLLPLASYQNALFLHNEVPGMQIPRPILDRMERVEKGPESLMEGVRIAQEALLEVAESVVGAYVMPPLGRYEAAIKILEVVGYEMPPSARAFPGESVKKQVV